MPLKPRKAPALLLFASALAAAGAGTELGCSLGRDGVVSTLAAPTSVRQGDPLFADFAAGRPLPGLVVELLDAAGKRISRGAVYLAGWEKGLCRYRAYAPVPWDAATGAGELRVQGSGPEVGFRLAVRVEVVPRAFATEDIKLDPANTAIRTAPDPKKTAEAKEMQAIYARFEAGALWAEGAFVLPSGERRRSAGFGDRRRYLYSNGKSDSSWHAGIDFAVPVGTEVRAPAAGKIVFAGPRIVTGNTVVIEHLPGLYSTLMHLSSIVVPQGAQVGAGTLVALSGATGLATGPHLHWEVRAAGIPVDPDWFVRGSAEPGLLPPRPLDIPAAERASSLDFEGR